MIKMDENDFRDIAEEIVCITGEDYRKRSYFETSIAGNPCIVSFEATAHPRCIQEMTRDLPALFETRYEVDTCLVRPLYRPGERDITRELKGWL